jgi:hypothetical protein
VGLEEAAQLLRLESGIVEDARERATLEFSVKGNGDGSAPVGILT